MWSFIRTVLLFLVASYLVDAKATFTAEMTGPDGIVVQLDPDHDFAPFAAHNNRHRHNRRILSSQLDTIDHGGLNYSFNWCGAVATSNSSGWIDSVSGHFHIPKLTADLGKPFPQSMAAWVGVDGYSCRSGFLQAGVWITFLDAHHLQTNTFFYSWWPDNIYSVSPLVALIGDEVYFSVSSWRPNVTTGEEPRWPGAKVVLGNVSNNVSVIVVDPGPPHSQLCGKDAEWVIEDPRTDLNNPSSPQAEFASFMPVKLFDTAGGIQYHEWPYVENIFMKNMTSRIYLRDNDGLVKCTAQYSLDPEDDQDSTIIIG